MIPLLFALHSVAGLYGGNVLYLLQNILRIISSDSIHTVSIFRLGDKWSGQELTLQPTGEPWHVVTTTYIV